ncbi:hypothetical protein J3F84DRAFT_338054 [Trichoderma pleuroticola]
MFAGAHSSCKCLCHPTSKEGARSGHEPGGGGGVSGIRCLLETRLGKGKKKRKKEKGQKARGQRAACGSPSTRDIVGDTQGHGESSLEQKPCPVAYDKALIETHTHAPAKSSSNDGEAMKSERMDEAENAHLTSIVRGSRTRPTSQSRSAGQKPASPDLQQSKDKNKSIKNKKKASGAFASLSRVAAGGWEWTFAGERGLGVVTAALVWLSPMGGM